MNNLMEKETDVWLSEAGSGEGATGKKQSEVINFQL